MSLSWDSLTSYIHKMSMTTKVIIGGTTLILFIKWMTKKKARLPPGPFPLPLLGNLLSMRNKPLETLIQEWRKKYGPIFTIYLGPMRTIMLTEIDITTDALVKLGSDFSGRPFIYSLDIIAEGSKNIAFAQYGEHWKFQRKIAVQALRQYMSGNQFKERCHEITKLVTQNMVKEEGPIDFHMHMSLCVFNILHGLCFGNTMDFDDPIFRKMMQITDNFEEKFANGLLEDLFPPLRLWPTKTFKEIVQDADWFNEYIHKCMDEHRANFNEDALICLADNIIHAEKLSQSQGEKHTLSDTHAAQILADVFGAGVDTTRVTLDWIFLILVNYPDVQARMQKEIDAVVGQKIPGREHRAKLVYTEAVMFEAMRLYPAGPYALPHETVRDTVIGGYEIPKKTSVFVSLLSILHDAQQWEDPMIFKPERFLDETESKTVIRNKSFIPFSLGHRSCPGEGLAKLEILYIVVGLLQKFTFSLPPGKKVNMEPLVNGFTNKPPDFKVIIKYRF